LPRRQHRFLRCAFDDRQWRTEMGSKCRAMKTRQTPPDWPRLLARQPDRQRYKLLPFDDKKRRCKRGHFHGDSYRQPGVRLAGRREESPGAARLVKMAAI